VNDLKATLDAEIGEPPRSTVDVDAVVARERLLRRLRLAGAAAAASMAVAGLVAGTLALVGVAGPAGTSTGGAPPSGSPGLPIGTPKGAHCPPPPPSPSQSPSPWVTGDPAPTAPPRTPPAGLPAGAAPRLTTALAAAVRHAVGTPKLGRSSWGISRRPLEFGGGPCHPTDFDGYMASASILTPTGPAVRLGDLFVIVTVADPSARTACTGSGSNAPAPNETSCTASRGPRGELVVAATWSGDRQGTPPATWHDVTVSKPDGTLVTVHCGGSGPAQPNPPLTIAQLIEIGLNPGLSLGG